MVKRSNRIRECNVLSIDVITEAVTALVNSVLGFAPFDIFSALLNMPNMSNKLYQKLLKTNVIFITK